MTSYIHPLAVVEKGSILGEGTKIWHFAHVRENAIIGSNCTIGKGVFIDSGVRIGDGCKIQNHVSVYRGVKIYNQVFVGPHVCFTNDLLPRATNVDGSPRTDKDWSLLETTIQDGASIGANATIVAGVTLGIWCMIGAGSVVTKDVPPYALVYGNPGKVRGVVAPSGKIVSNTYRTGEYSDDRLKFWIKDLD